MAVWDPVVRLLHWSLAILVAIDLVRDDGIHRFTVNWLRMD